jgi:hypothetical protein
MLEPDYLELSYYTLSHGDPSFIHQYIVDAQTAQAADSATRPIALTFALTGLYLFLKKGFTGKEVQQFHVHMTHNKVHWPDLSLAERTCALTVSDVLRTTPGPLRDQKIRAWCQAVWDSYQPIQEELVAFLHEQYAV